MLIILAYTSGMQINLVPSSSIFFDILIKNLKNPF